MTRLAALSEADVRLQLYPSSGRVVKVTEGYWPSRLFHGDVRSGAVVYECSAPPPSEPRVWTDDAGRTWARCDDGKVLPVESHPGWVTAVIPARTRPEGEPDGNH